MLQVSECVGVCIYSSPLLARFTQAGKDVFSSLKFPLCRLPWSGEEAGGGQSGSREVITTTVKSKASVRAPALSDTTAEHPTPECIGVQTVQEANLALELPPQFVPCLWFNRHHLGHRSDELTQHRELSLCAHYLLVTQAWILLQS